MSLPDQEPKDTYTQTEVQHIVAREMAKQQIKQLEQGQIELNKKMLELKSELLTELHTLRVTLEKQPETLEKDFVSRMEALKMKSEVEKQVSDLENKVDSQWLKITIPIGVITALGAIANWLIAVKGAIQ